MDITPANAIKIYLSIRDGQLKQLTKEFSEKKTELEAAMASLEGYFLKTMQDRDESQIKTDEGVAFRSTQMRAKMANREAFIDYVHRSGDFGGFTNHVSKEFVETYIEANGSPPPGVETTTFITCNVRKA